MATDTPNLRNDLHREREQRGTVWTILGLIVIAIIAYAAYAAYYATEPTYLPMASEDTTVNSATTNPINNN